MSTEADENLTTGETEPPTPETGLEPEPENPDAEPEPEPEPIEPPSEPAEPAPEPEGLSPKEREAQQKKIDKEAKRHTDTITALLGDEADDVTECPFCDPRLQGFFYDSQLATPRSEIQAAMIEALTQPRQAELLPAADVARCETCDGYGSTVTGSRKPGNETKVCSRCKGYGFYPPPGASSNGPITQDEAHELVLAGQHSQVIEDADPWGSPRLMGDGQENPNYGKMPQYKNPDLP